MVEQGISAEERKWRAEQDARTIADYITLMKDKDRVKEASKVAEKRVEELTDLLNGYKQVAKKGGKK